MFYDGAGINKVFEWSSPTASFNGMILFRYDNVDLNNLNSEDLEIATSIDGSAYSILPSTTMTNSGFVQLNNNVSNLTFKHITLATPQLLSVNDIDIIKGLSLYPNPSSNSFLISRPL